MAAIDPNLRPDILRQGVKQASMSLRWLSHTRDALDTIFSGIRGEE